MTSNEHCIFVYGTLRRELGLGLSQLLRSKGEFIGAATLQGRLYDVGHYPAAIPSEQSNDEVSGDVYRLAQPGPVLAILDEYEGCDPGATEPTQYRRILASVRLSSDGREIEAWFYAYNWPVDSLERIHGGDYVAYRLGQIDPS